MNVNEFECRVKTMDPLPQMDEVKGDNLKIKEKRKNRDDLHTNNYQYPIDGIFQLSFQFNNR